MNKTFLSCLLAASSLASINSTYAQKPITEIKAVDFFYDPSADFDQFSWELSGGIPQTIAGVEITEEVMSDFKVISKPNRIQIYDLKGLGNYAAKTFENDLVAISNTYNLECLVADNTNKVYLISSVITMREWQEKSAVQALATQRDVLAVAVAAKNEIVVNFYNNDVDGLAKTITLNVPNPDNSPVTRLHFAEKGHHLLISTQTRAILWDINKQAVIDEHTFAETAYFGNDCRITINKFGESYAVINGHKSIVVKNVNTGETTNIAIKDGIEDMRISADNRFLFTVAGHQYIKYDCSTGEELKRGKIPMIDFYKSRLSPTGDFMIYYPFLPTKSDGTIQIYQLDWE